MEKQPTKAAILNRLQQIGIGINEPVSLYEIGTALVPAGYSEHEIVNALFALQSDKLIELMAGNRLRVILPFEKLS